MVRPAPSGLRGLFVLAVLMLLSGCLKLDADLAVGADDTVSGRYVVAYVKDPARPASGLAPPRELLVSRGSAESRRYDDGTLPRHRVRAARGVLLRPGRLRRRAAAAAADRDAAAHPRRRRRQAGRPLRLPGDPPGRPDAAAAGGGRAGGSPCGSGSPFPATCTSANGRIEGRSVTWDIPPLQLTALTARASALPPAPPAADRGPTTGAVVGMGVGGLAVLLAAVLLLRRRRRSAARRGHRGGPRRLRLGARRPRAPAGPPPRHRRASARTAAPRGSRPAAAAPAAAVQTLTGRLTGAHLGDWDHAAHPQRARARGLPGHRPHVPGAARGAPARRLGEGRHRRPGRLGGGRQAGAARHGRAGGVRRRRGRRLPLQRGAGRGDHPARGHRHRLRPAQRHRRAVPALPRHRRAEEPLAAGLLRRRADHRDRDERARRGQRPAGDQDDAPPRRRRLGAVRLEDLHHQRDQRRPRAGGRQDRPGRRRRPRA